MAGNNQYRASQFIKHIPGSGGIISTIASRVGCDWHTAKKYIDTMPTVAQVYKDEVESVTDLAESLLLKNIQLAQKEQKETGKPVDTADARWYLTRKGKGRGYTERTEQEITGKDGEPLNVSVTVHGADFLPKKKDG